MTGVSTEAVFRTWSGSLLHMLSRLFKSFIREISYELHALHLEALYCLDAGFSFTMSFLYVIDNGCKLMIMPVI